MSSRAEFINSFKWNLNGYCRSPELKVFKRLDQEAVEGWFAIRWTDYGAGKTGWNRRLKQGKTRNSKDVLVKVRRFFVQNSRIACQVSLDCTSGYEKESVDMMIDMEKLL